MTKNGFVSLGLMAILVAISVAVIGMIILIIPDLNIPGFPKEVLNGMTVVKNFISQGMFLASVWFGGWVVAISFSLIIANLIFWPVYSTVMWFVRKFGGMK